MGNKLYVGNVSFNVSEQQLTDHFAAFGDVTSCKIITDRDTGRSKGFAFVEMATSDEAAEAIAELDGKELDGRGLRVNEAKPQEKRERPQRNNRW